MLPPSKRSIVRPIGRLLRLANQQALARGHRLSTWVKADPKWWRNKCAACGMRFGVLHGKYPLATAVTGTALAFDCSKPKKKGKKT